MLATLKAFVRGLPNNRPLPSKNYVCAFIYICTYIHTCIMYVCMYVCMHACTYVSRYAIPKGEMGDSDAEGRQEAHNDIAQTLNCATALGQPMLCQRSRRKH